MAVALDCEMITVIPLDTPNKFKQLPGRVSIVDANYEVLLDKYCRPDIQCQEIRLNTWVSGITPDDMETAESSADVCQQARHLLQGKLVVGHDLNCDFAAIGLRHERRFDTSSNVKLRELAGLPLNQKPKLRALSKAITGQEIQVNEHSSVEDAMSAMRLYRIAEGLESARTGCCSIL